MDIERLKKIAGLTESESLESEMKRAEVERATESEKAPSFKGLLSEPTQKSTDFDFLKSIRRREKVEEAGYDPEKPYDDRADAEDRHESNYIQAQEYFDEAFGLDHIKTDEGRSEISKQLLGYMGDYMNDPKAELVTVQDWADFFNSAWESYEDAVLSEHGTEYTHDEHDGHVDYYEYKELKLADYYENYFASEFAKWAQANQQVLTDDGYPEFPEVAPAQFANLVKPKQTK